MSTDRARPARPVAARVHLPEPGPRRHRATGSGSWLGPMLCRARRICVVYTAVSLRRRASPTAGRSPAWRWSSSCSACRSSPTSSSKSADCQPDCRAARPAQPSLEAAPRLFGDRQLPSTPTSVRWPWSRRSRSCGPSSAPACVAFRYRKLTRRLMSTDRVHPPPLIRLQPPMPAAAFPVHLASRTSSKAFGDVVAVSDVTFASVPASPRCSARTAQASRPCSG